MKYVNETPDFDLSPYTGMTKKHWMEVATLIMEGLFTNIKDSTSPIMVDREDMSIGYPKENDSKGMVGAAEFEGLSRSFLLAAPMIKNKPDINIKEYNLVEYYSKQIISALDPKSDNYVGGVESLVKEAGAEIPFQHTCECAALVISLMMTKEHIWDKYTKEEKDIIANYLTDMGNYRTHHHNWRLFNMLMLAFLHANGYEIDKDIMKDHATNSLNYYVGDGWYRDGQLFDYYSPWAFQVYGPIWNNWYGYEQEPKLAAAIEDASNELMEHYPNFFDKDSHMLMWGRSNIYRNAASSPLAANFFLKNHTMDPGLARRILSGNLLQFVTKEEIFVNNVPCFGFYGPFLPIVQQYSCAMSPFWFAKSFMCLALEDDHPFWTAKEKSGTWENIKENLEINLPGPGINLINNAKTGTVEMRTSKIMMNKAHPYMPQYSRLSFNTKFPWEEIDHKGPGAMQYTLKYGKDKEDYSIPNLIMYAGMKNGVLYRRAFFDVEGEFRTNPYVDLADIPLDNGILRIDRVNIAEKPYTLHLGHYGLPNMGSVETKTYESKDAKAITAKTQGLQLAMVSYKGLDSLAIKENINTSAVTKESTLIYGTSRREKLYGYGDYIIITAMLHKTDNSIWTEDELYPVDNIILENEELGGNYGKITVILKNGKKVEVDFKGQEGKLSI